MRYFKKIIIPLLLLTIFFSNTAYCQSSIKVTYEMGQEVVKMLEEKGFEVVHVEYDVLSTAKTTKSLQRNLSSGYEYFIIGFGNDNIPDLDIKLYKDIPDEWEFTAEDDSDNNAASVKVTPAESKLYLIKVLANEFAENQTAGYYGLVIAHHSPDVDEDVEVVNSDNNSNNNNSELANLSISTNQTQYGVYENEDVNINKTVETATLFKFNANLSQFQHTNETISSTYFINSKEYDDEDGIWTLEVVSDVGNKYTYLINLTTKTITAVIFEDDGIRVVIFQIKSFWDND